MPSLARALSTLATTIALALPAGAQSVISTRSGVIHFFEGAVYLGDQPLEAHLGRYPSLPQGGELRTMKGRAEVLLTPGVFLRMGEQSRIRMVANDLADTQVELLDGSAIVESGEPNLETSVTLIYRDWRVHLLQRGTYRVDSDPARLWVSEGKAEVNAGNASETALVEQGMDLPFQNILTPERASAQPADGLGDWSKGRGQSISADNQITAQIDEDPTSTSADFGSFSYFPLLGVPSVSTASPALYGSPSLYSSYLPYQPGFNSIYLPGYTYPPLILGLLGGGPRSYLPGSPRPVIGISRPGVTITTPRTPYPVGITPRAPVATMPRAPAPIVTAPRPAPVRVAPPPVVRGGAAAGRR